MDDDTMDGTTDGTTNGTTPRTAGRRVAATALAVVLLLSGLGLTGVVASAIRSRDSDHHRLQRRLRTERVGTAIERRTASYVEVLSGVRGLFAASETVTRLEFDSYVTGSAIDARYPGIQALEFVRLVPTAETAAFTGAVRDEGLGTFSVFPSRTPHPDRFVVDYVHPLAGNESALGYDLGTEDIRRASVERARDTGAPVASRRIDLIQTTDGDVGVLLLLAVYESARVPSDVVERRATFTGVVAGVFRMRGMLDGVTGGATTTSLEVYDTGPVGARPQALTADNLLYDSDATMSAPDNLAAVIQFTDVEVAGRRWRVFVDPSASPPGENRWLIVAAAGVLLVAAAAIVVLVLARSRTHAIDLAHRMTAGLSRSADELREALARAESADRAKSQFVSNVSHELRTPLNGIIGACQLLSRTTLDERQNRYVELGATSADALLALVDDVLDLAKIESGVVELEQRPFDPARLVEQLTAEYAMTVDGRLTVAASIDPALPTALVGDEARLRQVLRNLLSNAVKFTSHGGVRVAVTVDGHHAGRVDLHIAVADSGIGMTEDQAARVFERFQQADTSTTRRYGGTGLGLSIVAQLVDLMGGRIWIDTTPGVGSTFHVTCTLDVAGPTTTSASQPPARADQYVGMDGSTSSA